jgi:hypothetical protein
MQSEIYVNAVGIIEESAIVVLLEDWKMLK